MLTIVSSMPATADPVTNFPLLLAGRNRSHSPDELMTRDKRAEIRSISFSSSALQSTENIQTSSHAIELRELVRMANATSFHLYQNLSVRGKSQLNLLNNKRPAVLLEGGLFESLGEAHCVIF
jgi:hypothetical protein